ncbi:MAG TPA: hypothetical protein VMA83_03360 [Solirubrobacteraceae bacterium]|nr:hypothetical protein [Solirubrobacteraceae bacterium]
MSSRARHTQGAVALASALALGAAVGARLAARRRAQPERARIDALFDQTGVGADGAVRSVQVAELTIDDDALAELWSPMYLERLARTYWRFLTRVTLGLVRVVYTPTERRVVLLVPALRLLTFAAPEYELDSEHGLVRWRIDRGILVARRGRDAQGRLQIEVERLGAAAEAGRSRLRLTVEVANFYPSIASAVSTRIYGATQSRIHVVVALGFLRSLVRLDLAPSRVGRFVA